MPNSRRKNSWGRGSISGMVEAYGWMALGVMPKNTRTLDNVFLSGHPRSGKNSFAMVRPFTANFNAAGVIADNPEKHLKLIRKIGLAQYLLETA